MIDPRLIDFAQTDRQREILSAIIEHGSVRKGAAALGVHERRAFDALRRVKGQAAQSGYAPTHDMTHPVPDGFQVRGVSTYYDEDGKVRGQWVKSGADDAKRLALLQEVAASLADEIPRAEPVRAPALTDADLANCYVITDYHLGMYAWAEETGDDWDTDLAENLLVAWFAAAIKSAPKASVGVLAQLGDFMHWDGLDAVTPTSKHLLDADTRFQRVVRVAIRALRRIVRMLLKKHDQVHVLMLEGNHDPASSAWMRELLAALYDDEPRVSVDQGVDGYHCYEHGATSLFFHHGHKRKPANIADVFAAKFRETWGRTKHSYAHMGHLHHVDVKETNLMIVEQHRTLAGQDAYAARGGWLAGRDAKVITYHRKYGEVGRVVISPEMLT